MNARQEFTDDDFEVEARRKRPDQKRPKGTLPYLPDADELNAWCDWLTAAFRPRHGRVVGFERAGLDREQACTLIVQNGRDQHRYRFKHQGDLMSARLRPTVLAVGGPDLRMPHLTTGEVEDVWAALCMLGAVQPDDEVDQARDWLHACLDVARPLEGYTLNNVADRRDALLELRRWGEFTHLHAIAVVRNPDGPWPRQPACLVDRITGDFWLRVGESLNVLRHIVGVNPLKVATLTARFHEIGVDRVQFDDRRAHPRAKARLYRVPQGVVTDEFGASE